MSRSWTETAAQVHLCRALLTTFREKHRTAKESNLTSRHCVLIKTRGGVLKKHGEGKKKKREAEARLYKLARVRV